MSAPYSMSENISVEALSELEKKLGYTFKDIKHLRTATTHSSFCHLDNYERYEFLGDSILNFIISEYLIANSDLPEGELTRIRSALICGSTLSSVARQLDLGKYVLLSRGEIQNQGRARGSILEDVVEAVTAAIYLDSQDFELVKKIVMNLFHHVINHREVVQHGLRDSKTMLQELVQELWRNKPIYRLVDTSGKSHNQTFYMECEIEELAGKITKGMGRNKRQAEQNAATEMLKLLISLNLVSAEQRGFIEHNLAFAELASC